VIHVGPPIDDMVFGMELVLDIDGCDQPPLTHPGLLNRFALDLVELLDMKAYGPCELWHFGHDDPVTAGYTSEVVGFTGDTIRLRQLIETSSIVGHFSPELRRAHLNIFSCRRFDPEKAAEFCTKHFGGTLGPTGAVLLVR
jgi:hypothetical protein